MPGTISQYQVVIAGQLITASLWNGMELNIINNGLVPSGIDDYSTNDAQMQTQTDPYPASATSRPTSLQGELERLRYQFDNIIGKTYWYEDPDVDIATFKTRFDAHTHDGTSNNGPQILAGGIADNAVTTAKINNLAVTTAKLADASVNGAKIVSGAVGPSEVAASLAGNGLTGGGGSALSVNVDGSTLEINSDTLRLKDNGITTSKIGDTQVTYAKLASDVTSKLSPKTIQRFTTAFSFNFATESVPKTVNQTITSVDTTKAYVLTGGYYRSAESGISIEVWAEFKVKLTSATNVEIIGNFLGQAGSLPGSGTVTYQVEFTVVEWN